MEPDVSIPSGDPDRTLVPLVRQHLAQTRQQTLATMVQLGMQRIVVDGGRIHASMRFHIDTRSAAQADEGSTFDFRNTINAAGSFGWGPWGVSASMQNTIGYVSTSQTQTTEEMNVDLDPTVRWRSFSAPTRYRSTGSPAPTRPPGSGQQSQPCRRGAFLPTRDARGGRRSVRRPLRGAAICVAS